MKYKDISSDGTLATCTKQLSEQGYTERKYISFQ